MELLFIVVSLVIQIGSTEGTCRCLDQTLCGDTVSGCKYRCQPGFTGENCQYDNLGYLSTSNAKKLFDGDYSTCLSLPIGTKINFTQPIDVDTIRVHRENNYTGEVYPFIYINTRLVSLWRNYQFRAEGPAAATYFPVQTGVTAVEIVDMGMACEVELINANECSQGFYGANCTESCNEGCQPQHCDPVTGDCNNRCRDGWTGQRCETECASGRYGHNCSSECSEGCNSGTCDRVSGRCSCKPGWTGDRCSERCEAGSYGDGCNSRCNEGCVQERCDPINGDCTDHCRNGWTGHNCLHQCPHGAYGRDCHAVCSEGCERETCHHVSGNCSCKDGWTGEKCSEQKGDSYAVQRRL